MISIAGYNEYFVASDFSVWHKDGAVTKIHESTVAFTEIHANCGGVIGVTVEGELKIIRELRFGAIQPNTQIKSISFGSSHLLALSYTGSVFAMGENGSLQCGTGLNQKAALKELTEIEDLPEIKLVVAAGNHSIVISEAGEAYGFGDNSSHALGLPYELRCKKTKLKDIGPIVQCYTNRYTVFVTEDGSVYFAGKKFGDSPVKQDGYPPITSAFESGTILVTIDDESNVWAKLWNRSECFSDRTKVDPEYEIELREDPKNLNVPEKCYRVFGSDIGKFYIVSESNDCYFIRCPTGSYLIPVPRKIKLPFLLAHPDSRPAKSARK